MNFFIEAPKNKEPLNNFEGHYIEDKFLQMTCELKLQLGYVNSDDVFEQTFEFSLMILKETNNQIPAYFENIESSIIKAEVTADNTVVVKSE